MDESHVDNSKVDKEKTEAPQVRPVVRFFARQFDLTLVGIMLMIPVVIILPEDASIPRSVGRFLSLLIWILIEAILLCTWGTTPGKSFFRITLRATDGEKLRFSQALLRSIRVWVEGCGAGIPILNLLAPLRAYHILENYKITPWDKSTKCQVAHSTIGIARTIIAICFFAIVVLMAIWSIETG